MMPTMVRSEGIFLAARRFPCRRRADADHPVTGDAADRIDRDTARATDFVLHHQQRSVTKRIDAIGGNQGFLNSHDSHRTASANHPLFNARQPGHRLQ
jgi:hypothetical protein